MNSPAPTFAEIIAAERAKHEAAQKPTSAFFNPLIKPKKGVSAAVAKPKGISVSYDADTANALVGIGKAKQWSQYIFDVLGKTECLQFHYVTPVINTIVGWLAGRIAEEAEKDCGSSKLIHRIIDDMDASAGTILSTMQRFRNGFVEQAKYYRTKMFEDGFMRHIEILKEQYRLAIVNAGSPIGDDNTNGNDLIAWCYTAIALAEEGYAYDSHMAEVYNTRRKDQPKMHMHPFRMYDSYPAHKQLCKFVKYWGFPPSYNNSQILMARNVIQTQLRLAKIEQYLSRAIADKMMEGTTIKIS